MTPIEKVRCDIAIARAMLAFTGRDQGILTKMLNDMSDVLSDFDARLDTVSALGRELTKIAEIQDDRLDGIEAALRARRRATRKIDT